jgi:RNA polymerase sigma factor (sigma-70 family)
MSVYIEGIGNQKISYPDHDNIKFASVSEYLLFAKKSISKFANNFYNGLSRIMLQDDDAISNVAYCIMLADWRYNENYHIKVKNKTRYSYRNQCAIWAIQSYITKNYKKNSQHYSVYSLDYSNNEDSSSTCYNYIQDHKVKNPSEAVEEQERTENLKLKISQLINNDSISDQQKEYIRLYYYEGKTFEQIGKKFSLTREAIRQSIKKAIKTIRETNSLEVSQHEHF